MVATIESESEELNEHTAKDYFAKYISNKYEANDIYIRWINGGSLWGHLLPSGDNCENYREDICMVEYMRYDNKTQWFYYIDTKPTNKSIPVMYFISNNYALIHKNLQ